MDRQIWLHHMLSNNPGKRVLIVKWLQVCHTCKIFMKNLPLREQYNLLHSQYSI
jgi:hypothetical protein